MAKKAASVGVKKLNKAKLVREYRASHPQAKATEIAQSLTKQTGVEFEPRAVSASISNAKRLKRKKDISSPMAYDRLVEFIQIAGSLENAKSLLDHIEAFGGVESARCMIEFTEILKKLKM